MSNIPTSELRALQKTLNETIDAYEESATVTASSNINNAAKAIASLTRGASIDFLGLGYQPVENMAIRVGIDLDLFTLIEESTPLDHLVRETDADPALLKRLLRVLVATKTISESQPGVYSSTGLSKLFRVPPVRDWMKTTYDTLLPIWVSIPGWLRENGYQDIADLEHNPTMSMYGKNLWDALADDPRREKDFTSAMKLQDNMPSTFTAQYPWDEAAASFDEKRSDVLIVDVGGGEGQYLKRVLDEHASIPGRKIVQDIPTVIAGIDAAETRFEPQTHDFFTPQPVKGARFYHLRGVLHDWPDESCLQILQHLLEACESGYSSILIHTVILPDFGVGRTDAVNDLNMWTCVGKERTRRDWDELLDKARLKISRVIMPEAGYLGYMEVGPS